MMDRLFDIKMLRDFVLLMEDVCSVTEVLCDSPSCSHHVPVQATSRQT